MKNKVSIVISSYNEEEGIYNFGENIVQTLKKIGDINFEVIWVNDGSIDNTQEIIQKIAKNHVGQNITHVSIEFSKNFGHEAAMIAGIDNATGNAIICMDADGQHPANKISEMLSSFNEGNDIVLMNRIQRADNGAINRILSFLFYKVINLLSVIKFKQNSSDFFLISNNVAKVLKKYFREKNRFTRGFIQSLGFSNSCLTFVAPERQFGKTHYTYSKLIKLAFSAVFTFSIKPLRISIFFSIIFIIGTLFISVYSLYQYIYGNLPPSGYTTIILFLAFSFSTLFVIISVLALYFEKIIEEIRQRPIYIIKDTKIYNE